MEFLTWRELAAAYVRVRAASCGWVVASVKEARSSSSVYLHLRNGPLRACVRLSDHRPSALNARRASLFSVRQGGTLRLAFLDAWLRSRGNGLAVISVEK